MSHRAFRTREAATIWHDVQKRRISMIRLGPCGLGRRLVAGNRQACLTGDGLARARGAGQLRCGRRIKIKACPPSRVPASPAARAQLFHLLVHFQARLSLYLRCNSAWPTFAPCARLLPANHRPPAGPLF